MASLISVGVAAAGLEKSKVTSICRPAREVAAAPSVKVIVTDVMPSISRENALLVLMSTLAVTVL